MEIVFSEKFEYGCGPGCGKCCKNYSSALMYPAEAAEISERWGITIDFCGYDDVHEELFMRSDPGGACVFLKDGKCGIHDYKPMLCELYPFRLDIDIGNYENLGRIAVEVRKIRDGRCTFPCDNEIPLGKAVSIVESVLKAEATCPRIPGDTKDIHTAILEAGKAFREISVDDAVRRLVKRGKSVITFPLAIEYGYGELL